MVSPKLLLLYTSTWKNILKVGGPSGHDLIHFAKTLATLREALTCSVCSKLLTGDELYSPSASSSCNHFACKDCKGGDRKDHCYCDHCQDWEVYREDETLSFLMQGYRQFCRYFLRSRECTRVLEVKYEVDPEFDALQLLDLLSEGSRQYKKPELQEEEADPLEAVGVVPISEDQKFGIKLEGQVMEVVLDKEEVEHEIDIKYEPAEAMQFHEGSIEEEEEIQTLDTISHEEIPMQTLTIIPTSIQARDPLGNYEELQQDEPEEEEIRSSSLRLATPPPQPPPSPQQTTSIMFQTSMGSQQQIQFSTKQLQSFVLASAGSSSTGPRQIQFTGARIPGTSTIRLARLSLDGRPLTMVRHIMTPSQPSVSGVRQTITLPLNASTLTKNKIIVRPTATAVSGTTPHIIQRWPDGNKVIQYASASTVLPPGTTICTPRATYSTVTTTPASSSTGVRPQQVTKISVGNMGAVVSTSSLSGIINRPATLTTSSGKIIGTIGTVVRTDSMNSDGTIKKLKVRLPKPKVQPKIRKGCRCGNAATQPGKLTCCGQRCPCYVDAKSCVDCRCRGCRNPHLPGGKKLLQGINAVIDTKTNTTVPLSVGSMTAGAGSSGTVVTSVPHPITSSTVNLVPVSASQIYSRIHYPGTTHATTTSYSQLIPLANFGGFSIPISLISPASHPHVTTSMSTIQAHSQPIRMQCIQSINGVMASNIKTETDGSLKSHPP